MKKLNSNTIEFANLSFKGLERTNILREEQFLKFIVTVNAAIIVRANNDSLLKSIIKKNYATFDGQIPYLLAKRKYSNVNIEKISGSDLIYDFCKVASDSNKRIFLLGGNETSNTEATRKLKNNYKIEIKGFSPEYKDYPFEDTHNQIILEKIKAFRPDILFVGFGAGKQEFWINEFKKKLENFGVRWVIGCGGTFAFVSGNVKRAPIWVQNMGFEGVYRLFQEPNKKRLKRLFFSTKLFKYV